MRSKLGESQSLRQEVAVSTEFHQAMLTELAGHHDEKATDWTAVEPIEMVGEAVTQIYKWLNGARDPKSLVHSANFLTIAWAITESRRPPDVVQAPTDQEGGEVYGG